MKRINKLLIILLILLPLNIKAEESITLKLNCPKYAEINQTISCSLETEQSTNFKGLKLNYALPDNLNYNDITINNNWNTYYKTDKGFVITKKNNTTNSNLATISFKINENAEINKDYNIILTNVEISDNNHKIITHPNIISTIKVLSNDSTLSNLTLSNGTLSPTFSKTILNYTSVIESDNTTITATPTNIYSTITGNIGYNKLNYGSNILTITVTSPLNTKTTYTIIAIVPKSATTTDTTNTTTNNSKNTPNTNQDQNTNNQTTTLSSDASLKELIVENYSIEFDKNTYLYELTVPNNITQLNIKATPNNTKASINIENKKLEIGKNYITITITAEDKTTCKYTIIVTREKKEQQKNNINRETSSTTESKNIINDNYLAITISIIIIIVIIITIITKKNNKKQ